MTLIRVAVLDDHPAVRAGVKAILAPEHDLVFVGAAAEDDELWPLLRRTDPGVLVLDVHHLGRNGLLLSLELKRSPRPPRIIVYSGAPPRRLAVPALLAGADAVVDKTAPPGGLLDAIRATSTLPPISQSLQATAAAGLDATERAIFAMRLAGTSIADTAAALGLPVREISGRLAAIVTQLTPGTAPTTVSRRRPARPGKPFVELATGAPA